MEKSCLKFKTFNDCQFDADSRFYGNGSFTCALQLDAAPPLLHPSICREHRYLTSRGGGVQSPDQLLRCRSDGTTGGQRTGGQRTGTRRRLRSLGGERWKDEDDLGGGRYVSVEHLTS